jgi:hypothetical protein
MPPTPGHPPPIPPDNPALYRHLVERLAHVLDLRAQSDAQAGQPAGPWPCRRRPLALQPASCDKGPAPPAALVRRLRLPVCPLGLTLLLGTLCRCAPRAWW